MRVFIPSCGTSAQRNGGAAWGLWTLALLSLFRGSTKVRRLCWIWCWARADGGAHSWGVCRERGHSQSDFLHLKKLHQRERERGGKGLTLPSVWSNSSEENKRVKSMVLANSRTFFWPKLRRRRLEIVLVRKGHHFGTSKYPQSDFNFLWIKYVHLLWRQFSQNTFFLHTCLFAPPSNSRTNEAIVMGFGTGM